MRDFFETPTFFEDINTVIADITEDYVVNLEYDLSDTSQVNAVEWVRNSVRFMRVDFTRTSGNVTEQELKIYDTDGTTVLRTRTYTYSYSGNNLTSVSRVET